MTGDFDIAVIGSGFAGSLLAMIARRLGFRVVLIERGRHPRFAIGESSTPLANLLLESLARRYDLPRLLPLTKWGSWQRTYPHLPCGLKRGFTFYHHTPEGPIDVNDRARQLLVAASPCDEIADTHWYRPAFDQFLVREAKGIGVEFLEGVGLTEVDHGSSRVRLSGDGIAIDARFVIDATGPRGLLHRTLRLPEEPFQNLPPRLALYAHFTNVARLPLPAGTRPYGPEDAAVHHVFDGGWVWVLRFNNGIVSAGIAATDALGERLQLWQGEAAWQRVLAMLPTLRQLFVESRSVVPFLHVPRLSFCSGQIIGSRWALLPSTAGFVDPLLSTGFPLTLLGIERIATAFESWDTRDFGEILGQYAAQTRAELRVTARMVAALYARMADFHLFRRLSLLYFAAASFSETSRRLGRDRSGFLLHDHPTFGPECRACCEMAIEGGPPDRQALIDRVDSLVQQFDVAGLSDPARNYWFPVDPQDVLRSAVKLQVPQDQVRTMLDQAGLSCPQVTE